MVRVVRYACCAGYSPRTDVGLVAANKSVRDRALPILPASLCRKSLGAAPTAGNGLSAGQYCPARFSSVYWHFLASLAPVPERSLLPVQSPATPGNVGVSGVVIGPEGRPLAVGKGGKAGRASMLPVVGIDPLVVPPTLGVVGAALELSAGAAAGTLEAAAGVLAGAPPP
jgi:hypothetical protein